MDIARHDTKSSDERDVGHNLWCGLVREAKLNLDRESIPECVEHHLMMLGLQLHNGTFPRVYNGGVVMPNEAPVVSSALGENKEINNEPEGKRRSATGSRKRTAGRSRASSRPRSSGKPHGSAAATLKQPTKHRCVILR